MRRLLLRAWIVGIAVLPFSSAIAEAPHGELLGVDPIDAYKAIEKAGESKDVSRAGEILEAGIQTTHPHLAVACGDALALLGSAAVEQPDYQKVLAKALRLREPAQTLNLARVLSAFGDPSVDEALASTLVGRRPAMLAEAITMAGSIRVTADAPFYKVVAAVGSALRAKQPEVVVAACSAAGRIKDATYVPLLAAIVRRSQEKYPGLYAVAALARIGARGGIKAYIHVLEGDVKLTTSEACLKAVTDLAAPEDVEDLLGLMRSTKRDHREAACIAIGLMAARGEFLKSVPGSTLPTVDASLAQKVLERLMQIISEDGDWQVRDAALRAVQRIGEPARAIVEEKAPILVGTFERDPSLAGIELAGAFGVKSTYGDLMKLAVFDKDRVQRMFAARALSTIDPDAAIDEWKEATQKDHKGREQTLSAIRAMGYVRTAKAYTTLVSYFEAPQKTWSEEIQSEVERSLERITGHRFGRRADRWAAWYATAKNKRPFTPHIKKFDRTKNRKEAVANRLYGLTETTERSVEAGLIWLEEQQLANGSWDGAAKGFLGVINCEPAYTGLALLALLGAGYNSAHGKFRETVRRGTEFLITTQYYDGGFPVTGGGDDSWIFAYSIGMAVWGVTEAYGLSGDPALRWPSQRGCDYLVRVQTPGGGWRYSARMIQSDTSCTSWVLMTLKSATMLDLEVPSKAIDGIDSWLERCGSDITGEDEIPEDLMTAYDKEVGAKRVFKAFTGYFELSGHEASALQMTSITAVGMACRFFMGWKRSHPFLIGSANYLLDYLPQWHKGLEKNQAIAWYFYFYYYGTLAMHQMGGRYWRAWNEKIKVMLPAHQKKDPPELAGSWDSDTAVLDGGRLFATSISCLTLETYYRFSPLLGDTEEDTVAPDPKEGAAKPPAGAPPASPPGPDAGGMDGGAPPAMGDAVPPAMGDAPPAMGDAPPAMGDSPPGMDAPPAMDDTPPAMGGG